MKAKIALPWYTFDDLLLRYEFPFSKILCVSEVKKSTVGFRFWFSPYCAWSQVHYATKENAMDAADEMLVKEGWYLL